ncbi:MAG: glycosyltransferase family 4 protein, partial [Chloroflexi bacterium]|nr:glycosyltransferase family 4 protein [Chloroflexota bacterium]
MRVAYYAPVDTGIESGVMKKIVGQVTVWQQMGIDARIFAYTSSSRVWEGIPRDSFESVTRGGLTVRLIRVARLVRRIIQWRPDLVYMRQGFYYPPLEYLMRRVRTIVEVNTLDVREAQLYLGRIKRSYYLATRSRLLRNAAGLVCVTEEIARALAELPVPITVVPNGIDLSAYRPLEALVSPSPRLVFIGHEWDGSAMLSYRYQGIDKILRLARAFPTWRFDIVGYQSRGQALPNVRLAGHLSRLEYEKILACADVAVGTLGLHVKGMDEACPLKVREYLAYGIPTIIGYQDTDFPHGAPFLLRLPNTSDNVDKNLD